jgi:organic radical activating enzyme
MMTLGRLRAFGQSLRWSVASPATQDARKLAYDVEADWQLLNTCNYRCSYCFFPPGMLGEKLKAAASPQIWSEAIDATGWTWLLHLTGGEPSIYPGFSELCARLSQKHYLSMNSNLSQSAFTQFAETVDPKRVTFINAGLHDAEREHRGGFTIFLKNAGSLLDRDFPLFVSIVATPAVLADPERIIHRLRPIGMIPFPKLLQGDFAGKTYPGAYTAGERHSFRAFARAARDSNSARMATWLERPSIDLSLDDTLLDGVPSFRGQSCEAGRRFVRLEGDGGVFRCSTDTRLGNLLDGSLRLRQEPAPCDTQYCFYFCRKYSKAA